MCVGGGGRAVAKCVSWRVCICVCAFARASRLRRCCLGYGRCKVMLLAGCPGPCASSLRIGWGLSFGPSSEVPVVRVRVGMALVFAVLIVG